MDFTEETAEKIDEDARKAGMDIAFDRYYRYAELSEQLKALVAHYPKLAKLESIGHLAAGVAHEINTPMQYIGDNTAFLGVTAVGLTLVYRTAMFTAARQPGELCCAD